MSMFVVIFLSALFGQDDFRAWSETLDLNPTHYPFEARTTVAIDHELTLDRGMPVGRVHDSRAFLYWTEKILESPQLMCLELPSGKVLWQQPASRGLELLLFTRQQLVTAESPKRTQENWQFRSYNLETGEPEREWAYPKKAWFRLYNQHWLVGSNGEIWDLDSGELLATASLQQIQNALVHGETLIALDVEPSTVNYDSFLHKIDLRTGKTLYRHRLSQRSPNESKQLIAVDDHRAILAGHNYYDNERSLLSINAETGAVEWETPVPQFASVRIVNPLGRPLAPSPEVENLTTTSGFDINAATGQIELAKDRPSPVSRFDWYVPLRSETLALRWNGSQLMGWFDTGAKSILINVDPHTGHQIWSVPVSRPHTKVRWLPELGEQPRFAVFLGGEEDVQVIETASGRSSTIPRTSLGLPLAPRSVTAPLVTSDETTDTSTGKPTQIGRLVIVSLTALALGTFLFSRFRNLRSHSRPDADAATTKEIANTEHRL